LCRKYNKRLALPTKYVRGKAIYDASLGYFLASECGLPRLVWLKSSRGASCTLARRKRPLRRGSLTDKCLSFPLCAFAG